MTYQFIICSSISLQSIEADIYECDASKNPFSVYLPLPEKDVIFIKKDTGNNLITVWGKFKDKSDFIVFKDKISLKVLDGCYVVEDCS